MEFNPLLCLAIYWEPQRDGAKPGSQDTGGQKLSLGEKGSATHGSGKEGTPNFTFLSQRSTTVRDPGN